jgi:hypothetical protein
LGRAIIWFEPNRVGLGKQWPNKHVPLSFLWVGLAEPSRTDPAKQVGPSIFLGGSNPVKPSRLGWNRSSPRGR